MESFFTTHGFLQDYIDFLGVLIDSGRTIAYKGTKIRCQNWVKGRIGYYYLFLFCLCCEAENYFMVKHACIWALCTTILLMPHLLNRIECFLNNLI